MKNYLQRINNFYNQHSWLGHFCIIFFGFLYFGLMQANNIFVDPDSFYHVKATKIILDNGIIHTLPWLPYTSLATAFADHHFLYHLFLIPFILNSAPLIGAKVATVIINTGFIFLFYLFLKSEKIKYPFFFIFILLSSAPFIFRIDLVKASGFSLIFIILLLFAIFKKKYFWIFIVSFFYVWAYGGWPISIVLSGIFFIASIFSNLVLEKPNLSIFKKSEWKPLLFSFLGAMFGLIINPYFPQNISFYWLQIVQIALVNYQAKIGVGAEWYGFTFSELVVYSGAVFLPLLTGMMFFVGKMMLKKSIQPSYKKFRNIFFFTIVAGAFFTLTLKSKRNSEYFFPFVVLLSSFLINYFYDNQVYEYFKKNFLLILKKEILYKIFLTYIIIMLLLAFSLNFLRIKKAMIEGFVFDKYKEAMIVTKANSEEGDIIFHSDWDDWPMLFYNNDYNRYIVGLDTTFMYKQNPELYQKWRDITWDKYNGDAYDIIKNDFNAKIIFISDKDIDVMDKNFKDDNRYELLYDEEGKVYLVK